MDSFKENSKSNPKNKPTCERCNDSGIVFVDVVKYPDGGEHPRYTQCPDCKKRALEKQAESRFENLFNISGLNETEKTRLRDILPNGVGTAKSIKSARQLMQAGAGFLTIWGTPGNGKSMILQSLVYEYLLRGIPAVYITTFHMLNFIRAAFDSDGREKSGSASQRLNDLEQVPVLCLDELDKIPMTKWEFANVSSIINERSRGAVDGKQITVLAMNRKPHSFLDDHFISRFLGLGAVIQNNDSDWRVKK